MLSVVASGSQSGCAPAPRRQLTSGRPGEEKNRAPTSPRRALHSLRETPTGASPVLVATAWETAPPHNLWSGFLSQPWLFSCSSHALHSGESNYSVFLLHPFDGCSWALIHRDPLQVPLSLSRMCPCPVPGFIAIPHP